MSRHLIVWGHHKMAHAKKFQSPSDIFISLREAIYLVGSTAKPVPFLSSSSAFPLASVPSGATDLRFHCGSRALVTALPSL
ncbi:hypothetical protein CDAR_441471, partial [Caerostris darwini]